MAKKIIIHPGFPKSGTTALQASLMQSSEDLEKQNLLYQPPLNNAHHRAAWALTKYTFGWDGEGGENTPLAAWKKLCQSSKNSKIPVLISSEYFIRVGQDKIPKMKAELGASEYKIIFTLRPFAKVLPSRYQQSLQKGKTWTYDKWLHSLLDNSKPKISLVDYAGIIETWVKAFGANNVTIIIADESNPDVLYRRFESAIGITNETLKPAKIKRINRSLTASEVEILRQVNLRKPKKWKWAQYRYFIRGNFVKFLSDNPSKFKEDPKLQLPAWAVEFLAPYSKDQVERINNVGAEILGDAASLIAHSSESESGAPISVVPVEMAADLVIHLSSISRFAGISTSALVREIGTRLKRSSRFYVRILGAFITRIFK
ncbi:MAG: hypothetical protein NT032_05940 [Actinobacteria bacterium]|nr:hypothetical protein [Actinomycetota bacterium]